MRGVHFYYVQSCNFRTYSNITTDAHLTHSRGLTAVYVCVCDGVFSIPLVG